MHGMNAHGMNKLNGISSRLCDVRMQVAHVDLQAIHVQIFAARTHRASQML